MVFLRDKFVDETDADDDGDVIRIVPDGGVVRVRMDMMDGRRAFAFDADAHRPRYGNASDVAAYARFCRDAGLPQHPVPPSSSAREAHKVTVSNMWRNPPSATPWVAPRDDVALAERVAALLQLGRPVTRSSAPLPYTRVAASRDAADGRQAAFDGYVKRLQDAWKTPQTKVRPEPSFTDARRQKPPERHLAWFKTDPNAAGSVEQQQEKWLGSGDLNALRDDVERKRAQQHQEFSESLSNAWKTNPTANAGG